MGWSWCRGVLVLLVLSATGCDDAEPAGRLEVATLVTVEPASGGGTVASAPGDDATASTLPPTTPTDTAPVTTAVSNGDARVDAKVVATWGGEGSSWLLVDLGEGEAIEGSARVVVEFDEPDVECAGGRWPVFILRPSEAVTFELVAGGAAAGPAEVSDLRWSVPVVVAGRDLRIACPSRDELAATIAGQRAVWTAAAVRDYEFTLHGRCSTSRLATIGCRWSTGNRAR